MKWVKKIIDDIENIKLPLHYWAMAFVSLLLLRFFLESLFEQKHSVYSGLKLVEDILLWFGTLYFSTVLMLFLITKTKIEKTSKTVLIAFAMIVLVPAIDFLVSAGRGFRVEYIIGDFQTLQRLFVPFAAQDYFSFVTPGQSSMIILATALCAVYAFAKTQKLWKAAVAGTAFYLILFAHATLPNYLLLVSRSFADPSNLQWAHEAYDFILAATAVFLLAAWFYFYSQKKFEALFSNLRYTRILHYATLAVFGAVVYYNAAQNISVLGLEAIVASIFFAFASCLLLNNIFDKELNPALSQDEHYAIAGFCFIL